MCLPFFFKRSPPGLVKWHHADMSILERQNMDLESHHEYGRKQITGVGQEAGRGYRPEVRVAGL
jgi:hypothetical protein